MPAAATTVTLMIVGVVTTPLMIVREKEGEDTSSLLKLNLNITFIDILFSLYSDEAVIGQVRDLQMKSDDFDRVKVIGRGAFGEVQLVSIQSQKRVFFLFPFFRCFVKTM